MNKHDSKETACNVRQEDCLRYAANVITGTTSYLDFSIAMLDMFGEGSVGECRNIYLELHSLFKDGLFPLELDKSVYRMDEGTILEKYALYKSEQAARDRYLEFKENIDELQFKVLEFRKSSSFKKLLDFVSEFHYLAPYNAMMVYLQKPGASFVLTPSRWEKYGRRPKIYAQNLITLKPFGPIQCQYDFSDTEAIPGREVCDDVEKIAQWENLAKDISGRIDQKKYETLQYNIALMGIYLDKKFSAANSFGGFITRNRDHLIDLDTNSIGKIAYHSQWHIGINSAYDEVKQFACICHELGHLYCCHFPTEKIQRRLSQKEEEFEAETVSWLVCRRSGIATSSEEYLSLYASDGEIPVCSLDYIIKAVTKIEEMMSMRLPLKSSDMYKSSKEFKGLVDYLYEQKKSLQENRLPLL